MVMKTFPWEDYRFSVLSVERPQAELQRLLASHQYQYVCDHGGFGDQMWVDSLELSKGAASSISLDRIKVEEGPTVARFDDKEGGVISFISFIQN